MQKVLKESGMQNTEREKKTKKAKSKNQLKISGKYTFSLLWKWLLLALVIGIPVGIASAFFLISLDWVTNTREASQWIIWLLPLGGLAIGLTYHYYGQDVVKGNKQLLEEYHQPKKIIPFKMAPFVVGGTLITHLFGGSAGREGTAVQMGGAIADQFSRFFNLESFDRRTILIAGISAGFSAVFGTPLAGAIFAIEIMSKGTARYKAFIPALLTAVVADISCHYSGAMHTSYSIPFAPDMSISLLFWTILAGIIFGVVAFSFTKVAHFFTKLFHLLFSYAPLRPVVGGVIIAIVVYLMGTTKYIGLGIPTIVEAFQNPLPEYDFMIKLLLTTFTLAAGFKGGEVTPLFFIGATLGNVLFLFVPLPLALLAGMGFVAVFAGATNTPLACSVMGMELFGIEGGIFISVACFVAFYASGRTGIYQEREASMLRQAYDGFISTNKRKVR